jgi:hypothetical protein
MGKDSTMRALSNTSRYMNGIKPGDGKGKKGGSIGDLTMPILKK